MGVLGVSSKDGDPKGSLPGIWGVLGVDIDDDV